MIASGNLILCFRRISMVLAKLWPATSIVNTSNKVFVSNGNLLSIPVIPATEPHQVYIRLSDTGKGMTETHTQSLCHAAGFYIRITRLLHIFMRSNTPNVCAASFAGLYIIPNNPRFTVPLFGMTFDNSGIRLEYPGSFLYGL